MHTIAPVPNINGSKPESLAEQMMDVSAALDVAAQVMAKWQPHGRDYQIGGDYTADREEFHRRLRAVEEMAAQYAREARAMVRYYR